MKTLFLALALIGSLSTLSARAESKPIGSAIPTGIIGPSGVGFLFPGFTVAAGMNAAALPIDKATAVGGAFTPAMAGLPNNTAFGAVATSNKTIGIGGGYLGSFGSGATASSIFAGLGYRFGSASIGASVRSLGLGINATTSVDFSAMYTSNSGITVGAVGYDVSGSQQVGFGIGYKNKRIYHFEGDVLAPIKNASTSGYTILMSGGLSAAAFDLFFNLSYLMKGSGYVSPYVGNPSAFSYTLGVAFWIGMSFNVIGQYATFPGTTLGAATVGFTFVL